MVMGMRLWPGLALAFAIALASLALGPIIKGLTGGWAPPVMVLALVIGIALNPATARPEFEAGLSFCVKKLLRIGIALLGLRMTFGAMLELGLGTLALVLAAMTLTIVATLWLVRKIGLSPGYGALAGASIAICGASAALATSTVVPAYRTKEIDTAFAIVMANIASTVAMLTYPALCQWLGFDARTTGIVIGATIHDMAQVVSAGYTVSVAVGDTAVIVKLFRVLLLLPAILAIGWWFRRHGAPTGTAKVPFPGFALVFLALAALNTLLALWPAVDAAVQPLRQALLDLSGFLLLLAIAALGASTSVRALMNIGLRHFAIFTAISLLLLAFVASTVRLIA